MRGPTAAGGVAVRLGDSTVLGVVVELAWGFVVAVDVPGNVVDGVWPSHPARARDTRRKAAAATATRRPVRRTCRGADLSGGSSSSRITGKGWVSARRSSRGSYCRDQSFARSIRSIG